MFSKSIWGCTFNLKSIYKFFQWNASLISLPVLPERHQIFLCFPFSNNQHKWNFFGLCIAYLSTNFFISVVEEPSDILVFKCVKHQFGVVVETFRYRQDGDLIGRQPQWKIPGTMLN